MDIELMREFVVFSRYMNFSKAAGKLNLAQPTLSSHVAAMEKELGFDLVQRGKRLRLTPAGKRFCADAERIVKDYAQTVESCKAVATQKAGSLVFEKPIHQGGIDREFDLALLRFQEANPTIAVRKQATQDRTIHEILEEGIADVAFVFNDAIELYDQPLAARVDCMPAPDCTRGPYYLWLDNSHPLANRDSVKVTDIGGCRFLIPSSIRYQSLETLAQVGAELMGVPVNCSFWPGSYEECILNIRPDETMIVNSDDLREPAYSLVPNRCHVHLDGIEELIKPSFVFLKDNDNPALNAFVNFLASDDGKRNAD